MIERYSYKIILGVLIMISTVCIQAWSQESQEKQYADGVYEASNSILDVAVTIEEGKIADIKILEHRGGGQNYEEMVSSLIDTIIEEQSTQVDAVSGATVSSEALRDAIDQALKAASNG
ncbi:MAG: FMN-binding protein [Candidatus Omnitrophota bacterium]|jgi:uncharacterized protein with FMN-binding domain